MAISASDYERLYVLHLSTNKAAKEAALGTSILAQAIEKLAEALKEQNSILLEISTRIGDISITIGRNGSGT